MQGDPPSDSFNYSSRAGRRRDTRQWLAHLERKRADRDAFLQAQLEPDEVVVASKGDHPWLTDRRILWAHQLYQPPRRGEWVCEALEFTRISGWALGSQHDGRPLIQLEHQALPRFEHVPAHRLLWFGWGNAEGAVDHYTTLLAFGRPSNPVYSGLCQALERARITKKKSFVIRPGDTRDERNTSIFVLTSPSAIGRLRHGLRGWTDRGLRA